MASTWGFLKRILQKKIGNAGGSPRPFGGSRVDANLPLGIRIRGIVEIPQVEFILGGDLLKVKYPGYSNVVQFYGSTVMGQSTIHRFYLDSLENTYLLQIVTDGSGKVEECKLFMVLDEVFPQNTDEWAFWLAEEDGYIGLNVFQTKDQVEYERVWGGDSAEVQAGINRVHPLEFLETVYLDPHGEEAKTIKWDSMLYGRHVNDQVNEYLLLSAIQDQDEAAVQIMVGLEINPDSLKVM